MKCFRKLFEVLLPVAEGMQARDALVETEKRLTLSEYEKGEYASGGQRFDIDGSLERQNNAALRSSDGTKQACGCASCPPWSQFGHKRTEDRNDRCCKCLIELVEPRGIEPLTS